MLDKHCNVAVYTGSKCVKSANHHKGSNYSVQANMMLNDEVIPVMARTFEKNYDLPIAERVVKTMQAGQKAGGDIRGKQSAVLLVVESTAAQNEWMDKKINLRVDDHNEPLVELERLLKVHRAYEHMNNGDLAIEHGDMQMALAEYGAAEAMFPDNMEMKYWKAVALANNGRIEDALPVFKKVFENEINWLELTNRLPDSGLLNVSEKNLNQILSLMKE
jgi:uncharacterized Ntn-hydrolase superfamily protein